MRPTLNEQERRENVEVLLAQLGNALVLLELVELRVSYRCDRLLAPALEDIQHIRRLIRGAQSIGKELER